MLFYLTVAILLSLSQVRPDVFNIGVLAPITGAKMMGKEVFTAVNISQMRINTDTGLSVLREMNHTFSFVVKDTICDAGQGLYEVVEMFTSKSIVTEKVHAFIGTLFPILYKNNLLYHTCTCTFLWTVHFSL